MEKIELKILNNINMRKILKVLKTPCRISTIGYLINAKRQVIARKYIPNLQEAGWIESTEDPNHKTAKLYFLTESGEKARNEYLGD